MEILNQVNNIQELKEESNSTFNEKINSFYSKKRQQFQQQKQYQRVTSQPYQPPKLPPQKKQNQYTLVLDIDETLLHTEYHEQNDSFNVKLRPYAIQFLQIMSTFFEIVTFTAGTQEYGDEVIDNYLDPQNQYISHRLYKQNCKWYTDSYCNYEQFCIKDLSSLGRDLSKTIILDNIGDNFNFLQPFNGIEVKSYYQGYDQVLKDLITPLQNIVKYALDVKTYVYKVIKNYEFQQIDDILKHILSKYNRNKQQNGGCNQVLLKRKRKNKPEPIISEEVLRKILFFFIIIVVKMSYCTLFAFNKFVYCINIATENQQKNSFKLKNSLKIRQLKPEYYKNIYQNLLRIRS